MPPSASLWLPHAPMSSDDGRRDHYGEFYGRRPLPASDRRLGLVWGNCQAESLRVLLDDDRLATVRVPPVHELTPEDLPFLARLMERASVLISQPVAAGFRGLPLGTAEVAALAGPRLRTVRFPVIRYAGLFPFHAIVRVPGGAEPPIVPYHDLRTLTAALGGAELGRRATAATFRAVAADSVAELTAREERHGTVRVSDLLAPAGLDAAHTLNHPGNSVLTALAERVLEALGQGRPVPDPGRVLLRSVFAPHDPRALDALGIDAPGREEWTVNGEPVPDHEIRESHLEWYREHPEAAAAGARRHARVLNLLAAS